jgi:hypothetical protein
MTQDSRVDSLRDRHRDLLQRADRLTEAQNELNTLFGKPQRDAAHHMKWWTAPSDTDASSGFDVRRRSIDEALDQEFGSAATIKSTAAYAAALDQYRRATQEMYPPELWRNLERLRRGDHEAVDEAILFLEADPWCDRSGYLKQTMARYLRHVPLTETQEVRIQLAIIGALKAGGRTEFREYCRLARAVDSPSFRSQLAWLRDDRLRGRGVRQRSGWMLDAILRTNG